MGLRRRPPATPFPTAAGLAMLLMLVNAAFEVLTGVAFAAYSLLAAALAFVLGVGFLVLAVGLARLRRNAWRVALVWAALATLGSGAAMATTQDWRFAPLPPLAVLALLLVPSVRRALPAPPTRPG